MILSNTNLIYSSTQNIEEAEMVFMNEMNAVVDKINKQQLDFVSYEDPSVKANVERDIKNKAVNLIEHIYKYIGRKEFFTNYSSPFIKIEHGQIGVSLYIQYNTYMYIEVNLLHDGRVLFRNVNHSFMDEEAIDYSSLYIKITNILATKSVRRK